MTHRVAHCPACRRERITRRVAAATIHNRTRDLIQCTAADCELIWAVRPDPLPQRQSATA